MPDSPDLRLLAEALPPPVRLAVAYAPAGARGQWLALLALDARLARSALGIREPMLAQLRLAWWRDRFRTPASEWPKGEPLLAALTGWDAERLVLERLVDGWEGAVGGEADAASVAALVRARADSVIGLARVLGSGDHETALAATAARWAERSLPSTLHRHSAASPGAAPTSPPGRLSRAMRPLAILAELPGDETGPGRVGGIRAFGRIIRLGLVGR